MPDTVVADALIFSSTASKVGCHCCHLVKSFAWGCMGTKDWLPPLPWVSVLAMLVPGSAHTSLQVPHKPRCLLEALAANPHRTHVPLPGVSPA